MKCENNNIADLKKIFCDQVFKIYADTEVITKKVLTAFYGDATEVKFPVDIRGIIAKHNIDIAEMDLNLNLGFRMDKVNGYLRCIGKYSEDVNLPEWRIYIEYSDNEFIKRYILAHEFSHYLMKKEREELMMSTEINCVDPMLPKKKEELLADVMAAYLLMPPNVLLEEMKNYKGKMKENNRYPIDSVTFLRDIGNAVQISTYHAFLCYQYVRYYLCNLYEQNVKIAELSSGKSENSEMIEGAKKWLEEYGELFK